VWGDNSDLLVSMRRQALSIPLTRLDGLQVGAAHIQPMTHEKKPGPMVFNDRNVISLLDLQGLLVDIVRPDLRGSRLPLTKQQRELLRNFMAEIVSAPAKGDVLGCR
jgi:hypothetical protein